jgi:Flp pilus assembly protein TadG
MGGGVARRTRTEERGAAAVEFALVVPLLLLILFGIISYGYMLSFRQSVSQAAAEGARAAAVAPATADRQAVAYAAIKNVMGADCGSTYLSCSATEDDSCGCMSVEVVYQYTADPSKLHFLDIAMPDQLTYTSTVELTQ